MSEGTIGTLNHRMQRSNGGVVRTTGLIALLVGALVALDPTPAHAVCGNNTLTPGDSTITLRQGNVNRTYLLHVPPGYTGQVAVPLVVDMHGFTSTASAQKGVSGWTAVSNSQGFLLVHPQGRNNSWNAFGCCGQSLNRNVADVAWLRAVVADVINRGAVNEAKVFATGLSNGGSMSHRLACEAADLFAATVPVSFTLNRNANQCAPARPITVLHFHGNNDTTVNPNGGQFQSIDNSFSAWRTIDGCGATLSTQTFSANERCDTATACSQGVAPALCRLNGTHVLYNTQTTVQIAPFAWDKIKGISLAGKKSSCN